jgi:predicted RNase H-like nuclease
MRFVGIDLAWSDRNPTGGVVIEEHGGHGRLVSCQAALRTDADIVALTTGATDANGALVAIDAPLVVPNETGARRCDRLVSQRFGRYQAGARPAYRGSPSFNARIRGEDLVAALVAVGFNHSPDVTQRRPARQVFEVYPHPAMVVLFGLEKTLKYKHLRDRAARLAEYRRYQVLLRSLADADPPLVPPSFLDRDVAGLAGQALKSYEDLLDALLCAYVAYWCWHHGPAGYEILGDLATGYIVVPTRSPIKSGG